MMKPLTSPTAMAAVSAAFFINTTLLASIANAAPEADLYTNATIYGHPSANTIIMCLKRLRALEGTVN